MSPDVIPPCVRNPAPFDGAIDHDSGPKYRRYVAVAKAICATCPVWQQCLLENREQPGVIAGLTRMERKKRDGTAARKQARKVAA